MTLTAGSRLGPYEVLSAIGAGGMGEVYRARDTRLERTVAVKVLPAHLTGNEELRQRFEREAKTISQLSHPHICALYDVGREGDRDYLVMEYLEGESLAGRIAREGGIAPAATLAAARQVASALDVAHAHGLRLVPGLSPQDFGQQRCGRGRDGATIPLEADVGDFVVVQLYEQRHVIAAGRQGRGGPARRRGPLGLHQAGRQDEGAAGRLRPQGR